MFEFIKKFFKEEIENEEVKLEDLREWYNRKTAPQYEMLNSEINGKFSEIKEEIANLQENIGKLENAEIKDEEKVEARIKNVVKSHRANYIRVLNQLIGKMVIPDVKQAKSFCEEMEKELDSFGKTSVKSYYAVQHLYSDDVQLIAANLKNIGEGIRQIKQIIEDKNLIYIERCDQKISDMFESIAKEKDLGKSLEEGKSKLLEITQKISNLDASRQKLEQSNEFTELANQKERLVRIESDISRINNKIVDLFAPLESAFKKFQRVTLNNEKIVEKYAENPKLALFEDKQLVVLDILVSMRQNIDSGALDLNEKKKEKALENIQVITGDVLKDLLDEYFGLVNERDDVENMVKNSSIAAEIKDVEHSKEFASNKQELLTKEIAALELSKEKIDIAKLKEDVKDLVRKAVNVDIVIS